MTYATILQIGADKIPILLFKRKFLEEENYDNILGKLYEIYLSEVTFDIKNNTILLLRKTNPVEFFAEVSDKFTHKVLDFVFVEIELAVYDFAEKLVENYFVSATVYRDKMPSDLQVSEKSLFNLKKRG